MSFEDIIGKMALYLQHVNKCLARRVTYVFVRIYMFSCNISFCSSNFAKLKYLRDLAKIYHKMLKSLYCTKKFYKILIYNKLLISRAVINHSKLLKSCI